MSPDVGRIVFGCGSFGGLGSSPSLVGTGDDEAQANALLDHARRLGVRRFDTANSYGGGESERMLGGWLRRQGRAYRDGIEIATKVGNPHGCPPGERPLSAAQIATHLDRSLQRLGIEQVDLYYFHRFDPLTPLAESLEAMAAARQAGKIARFGVSNATLGDLEAVRAAAPEGLAPACVQNEFSLLKTDDLAEVIPATVAAGAAYVAYSPLAGGVLTGKYLAGGEGRAGARASLVQDYLTSDAEARVLELQARAEAQGVGMAQLALRFVLDTPGVGAALIAPRRIEQFAAYGLVAAGA